MRLYAAKTQNLWIDKEHIYKMLDRDRRTKVLSIKNREEQKRSIAAGLLLRYAFLEAGYSDCVWRQVDIGRETYGKPYIKGYPNFHFGLSHSGEWAACVTDCAPVGIDIQEIKPWKMTVAKRFYHEKEYRRLAALEGADRDRQTEEFYSIWTAKESVVKLSGRGIGAGISQYVTAKDYSYIYDTATGQTIHTRQYNTLMGYLICVCSAADVFPDLPEIVDLVQ